MVRKKTFRIGGFQRMGRVVTIAILAVVIILSLGELSRLAAQEGPAVAVQRVKAVKARALSREPEPAHIPYIDEDSSWFAPPPPPPEVIEAEGVLQCVPFARFMSGIALRGDAWTWWDKAAGIYARGNHPEPGAVLSFPGIERMPLGHVAVVTQVLTARKILIDHANWPNAFVLHGAISRDIQVADVSPENDWSLVRVQFGEGGPLGSVYPANGFIYDWNESGVRIARPRFSLDYALWAPTAPSVRMFNAITYLWALPPAERKKAYAAAGEVPVPMSPLRGRPVLVLGFSGSGLDRGALSRPLSVGTGGRMGLMAGHFIVR
jgi:CHAP domain